MCGNDAPISAAQMLGEVSRLLKPGGVYILITYGDPKVRMPHFSLSVYDWNTILYIQRYCLMLAFLVAALSTITSWESSILSAGSLGWNILLSPTENRRNSGTKFSPE